MTIQKSQIVGTLLAGGLSRRMGGGDKGLLEINGRGMLQRVADTIRPQVHRLVLNANGDPARFKHLNLPVVTDTVSENPGPLAGVLAGMRWTRNHEPAATHILTAPTDTPLLPTDLAEKFIAAHAAASPQSGNSIIVLAHSEAGRQPVIGLWPISLADDLEASISQGLRKVMAWADRHKTIFAQFPMIKIEDEWIDPFINANTPEELGEARRLISETDKSS